MITFMVTFGVSFLCLIGVSYTAWKESIAAVGSIAGFIAMLIMMGTLMLMIAQFSIGQYKYKELEAELDRLKKN